MEGCGGRCWVWVEVGNGKLGSFLVDAMSVALGGGKVCMAIDTPGEEWQR